MPLHQASPSDGRSEYPKSWPREPGERLPLGLVDLSPEIEQLAAKRLSTIRSDLLTAGEFYPREEVRRVLDYWGISAA